MIFQDRWFLTAVVTLSCLYVQFISVRLLTFNFPAPLVSRDQVADAKVREELQKATTYEDIINMARVRDRDRRRKQCVQ